MPPLKGFLFTAPCVVRLQVTGMPSLPGHKTPQPNALGVVQVPQSAKLKKESSEADPALMPVRLVPEVEDVVSAFEEVRWCVRVLVCVCVCMCV